MSYFYDKITKDIKKKLESGEVKTILFVGPQGCGKTYAAKKLQKELDIPMKIIEEWSKKRSKKDNSTLRIYTTNDRELALIKEFDLVVEARNDN